MNVASLKVMLVKSVCGSNVSNPGAMLVVIRRLRAQTDAHPLSLIWLD
jgi:hypothetical protein